MLQFKTLGWQKEDETSLNNILWKCHHGVESFFRYLALRSLYGKKAILCNDASLGEVTTDFSVHLLWCLKSPPFYGAC